MGPAMETPPVVTVLVVLTMSSHISLTHHRNTLMDASITRDAYDTAPHRSNQAMGDTPRLLIAKIGVFAEKTVIATFSAGYNVLA